MTGPPLVSGEAAALAETVAGLRAANARLRELIRERDELIAELRVEVAEAGELREQVEQPRREVADLAAPRARVLTRAASLLAPLDAVDVPFTRSSAMAAWPAHSPSLVRR